MATLHRVGIRTASKKHWKFQAKRNEEARSTKGNAVGVGSGSAASRRRLVVVGLVAVRPADAALRRADELDHLADGGVLAQLGLHAQQRRGDRELVVVDHG